MHLFDVVLFFHIAVAIAAFAIAGILHTAQYATRSAKTVAELRGWIPVTHRLEPLFPILALFLFALGAWLLHLSGGEFTWSDGWVVTAIVTLAVMEALGGAVLAPRGKRRHDVAEGAPDGPISPTAAWRTPRVPRPARATCHGRWTSRTAACRLWCPPGCCGRASIRTPPGRPCSGCSAGSARPASPATPRLRPRYQASGGHSGRT